MARLERQVESKHQSAAMEALRKRLDGAGKVEQPGMPGGKGTEKGSDYGSYIRSRLTDAFRSTIAYQTKNPEVVVRLTIDRTGKLAGHGAAAIHAEDGPAPRCSRQGRPSTAPGTHRAVPWHR